MSYRHKVLQDSSFFVLYAKQHFEIKKMTLKQCEEDKFEGERAAYCDIDAVIVEDGKEEKQELKEVPFLKKYGVWITPPPII